MFDAEESGGDCLRCRFSRRPRNILMRLNEAAPSLNEVWV